MHEAHLGRHAIAHVCAAMLGAHTDSSVGEGNTTRDLPVQVVR